MEQPPPIANDVTPYFDLLESTRIPTIQRVFTPPSSCAARGSGLSINSKL